MCSPRKDMKGCFRNGAGQRKASLVYTNETVMPGRLTPEKADIHV